MCICKFTYTYKILWLYQICLPSLTFIEIWVISTLLRTFFLWNSFLWNIYIYIFLFVIYIGVELLVHRVGKCEVYRYFEKVSQNSCSNFMLNRQFEYLLL